MKTIKLLWRALVLVVLILAGVLYAIYELFDDLTKSR